MIPWIVCYVPFSVELLGPTTSSFQTRLTRLGDVMLYIMFYWYSMFILVFGFLVLHICRTLWGGDWGVVFQPRPPAEGKSHELHLCSKISQGQGSKYPLLSCTEFLNFWMNISRLGMLILAFWQTGFWLFQTGLRFFWHLWKLSFIPS